MCVLVFVCASKTRFDPRDKRQVSPCLKPDMKLEKPQVFSTSVLGDTPGPVFDYFFLSFSCMKFHLYGPHMGMVITSLVGLH